MLVHAVFQGRGTLTTITGDLSRRLASGRRLCSSTTSVRDDDDDRAFNSLNHCRTFICSSIQFHGNLISTNFNDHVDVDFADVGFRTYAR